MRVAKKIRGTQSRPRLSVVLTLKHTYAQMIDDDAGHTLASASSLSGELSGALKHGDNVAAAVVVGQILAKKALSAGIKTVVFDRGRRRFHGRVRALAEAVRQGGLNF
ncbi:MAG: 50S ribosomal protein L18 [Elusimicrobia bacterium]|nr:50S ribosomal protein L18 [Elusimicrobiota bacterium]